MKNVSWWLAVAVAMAAATQAPAIEQGTQINPQNSRLQAGDYVWQPQAAPAGPVVVVVNLAKQVLNVYRNGVQIGRSTISSGRPGHRTPTGIFTILQKNVTHHSTIYHDASMPYMERLTWGGVAIHAGNLPGYPESHGCVHVPMEFAKKLYGITPQGTTVLVTDGTNSPQPPAKPDLVFSKASGTTPLPPPPAGAPRFSWNPGASPTGPLCIIYSGADQRIYVYRGGVEIGRAAVGTPPDQSVGDRVYAALPPAHPQGAHRWKLLGSLDSSVAPDAGNLIRHLVIPPPFLADVRQTITPGTTLVITDEPLNPKAAGGPANAIMDTAAQ